jgi:death on curing protein
VTRPLRFLSPEQIIAIHDTLLANGGRGGGPLGAAYEGVDAAVQAVKNSYYETLEELAAAYAVYIVQGHVFTDGNKRTGAAAMLTFLSANGRRATISDERLASMMLELQRRTESGEDVARLVRWISADLARRPPRSKRPRRRRA